MSPSEPVAVPLRLRPILKERVWGGRRLARFGRALPEKEPIGESWELADLPPDVADGRSVIDAGPHEGRTLHELGSDHPGWLLGEAAPASTGGFPLLVKLLDASENLSVQVHPTAEYVAAHPGTHVKDEAWLILEADSDAALWIGLRDGVDRDTLRRHVEAGTVPEAMVRIPARAGDLHYLPSGTCHALGAGMLVAEVQTPSDSTFRIHDWGREGRELHVEAALQCIRFPGDPGPPPLHIGSRTEDGTDSAPPVFRTGPTDARRLLSGDSFEIEIIEWREAADVELVTSSRPVVLMNLGPGGTVEGGGSSIELSTARTAVLPAALADARIGLPAGGRLLLVRLPDPCRDLLACDPSSASSSPA